MALIQRVIHKCALCKELVILDSDTIAVHLKSKHKGVSHKEYNAKYMVMGGRMTCKEKNGDRVELEEVVMEVDPVDQGDSEEKLSQEIRNLEREISQRNMDKAKLWEREMKENGSAAICVRNEVSGLKADIIHNVESSPESLSTFEKMDNFMTRLRPTRPTDVHNDISVELSSGREGEELTVKEGNKNTAEKEKSLDKCAISSDPNESVGTSSCQECGLKLLSEADLLKHLLHEHYHQYLLALAKQFFSGSACLRCGEIGKGSSVAIQLLHIGEKHRQFPR